MNGVDGRRNHTPSQKSQKSQFIIKNHSNHSSNTLDNTTTLVIKQQLGDDPTAIGTPPPKTKHRRVETGPRNLSGAVKNTTE